MIDMKKGLSISGLFCLLFAASLLMLTGCASTNKSDSILQEQEFSVVRFDDWQYRGFGKEYPEWVELVLDEKHAELEEYFSDINKDGLELCVVKVEGSDSDMCRHKITELSYSEEEAWMIEETWVRLNSDYYGQLENPYVYIRIFLIGQKE
jgi:hypothetical protein